MNQSALSDSAVAQPKIPVYLLKTKSVPSDAYEDHFALLDNGRFKPCFVPVLEHRFNDMNMENLSKIFKDGSFIESSGDSPGLIRYGGIIFTSQRAVDAFSQVVAGFRHDGLRVNDFLPEQTPLYVVGPATARALKALELNCSILGEESGNGETLAPFIAAHYNNLYKQNKPSLLFLVGEKRRDIIPRALSSEAVSSAERINIEELILYESVESPNLNIELQNVLDSEDYCSAVESWFVIFSPTGCKTVMDTLRSISFSKGTKPTELSIERSPSNFVATIGPTTRNHLIAEFSFEPHVCAAKPTPLEVGAGIKTFRKLKG